MTFPKDSSRDCARAWEAMPWVLNDSAAEDQSQWLLEHLAHCESCSAEFVQQSRLRRAISLPSDLPVDANVGLERLMARLDAPEEQQAPLLRRRSGGWMTRALVAAVVLQAIGVGAMAVKLWSTGDGAAYRTLSQPAAPMVAGAIHIVPDGTMKLADWDTLLHTLGLQVVSGPNDVGAYTVVPNSTTSTVPQTLQQLRATRGIRLAEPVAATP
jgi:hypothetical protein